MWPSSAELCNLEQTVALMAVCGGVKSSSTTILALIWLTCCDNLDVVYILCLHGCQCCTDVVCIRPLLYMCLICLFFELFD